MNDLSPYAGRWVALVDEEVAGVGTTAVAAAHAARRSRPRDRFQIQYVEPPGGYPLILPPLMDRLRPLLAQEAQPVYLVGGTVRDALIGQVSGDLDFVLPTGAVKLSFRVADALGIPAYVLDKERDAGRVVLPDSHTYLDFTCFRGPDLEADLRDRDFTINAMAMPVAAHTDASLIDPTGGIADLRAGLVRHIHGRSLLDDPVRALRGLRLALRLRFALAPDTAVAITEAAPALHTCATERIRDELLKLLQTSQPDTAVHQMHTLGLLPVILPEMAACAGVTQSPPHKEDVLHHTISTLRWLVVLEQSFAGHGVPEVAAVRTKLAPYEAKLQLHWQRMVDGGLDGRTLLRLGALYHDVGKPPTRTVASDGRVRFLNHDKVGADITARQLHHLVLSNQAAAYVQHIVAGHMRPLLLSQAGPTLSRRAVYRYFRATGGAGLDVAVLSLADHLATYDGPGDAAAWETLVSIVAQLFTHYFEHHEETVAPPPLVNGRDLMTELHLPPGPEVGRLLRLIQEAQAAGEVHTREQAIQLAHQSTH